MENLFKIKLSQLLLKQKRLLKLQKKLPKRLLKLQKKLLRRLQKLQKKLPKSLRLKSQQLKREMLLKLTQNKLNAQKEKKLGNCLAFFIFYSTD